MRGTSYHPPCNRRPHGSSLKNASETIAKQQCICLRLMRGSDAANPLVGDGSLASSIHSVFIAVSESAVACQCARFSWCMSSCFLQSRCYSAGACKESALIVDIQNAVEMLRRGRNRTPPFFCRRLPSTVLSPPAIKQHPFSSVRRGLSVGINTAIASPASL